MKRQPWQIHGFTEAERIHRRNQMTILTLKLIAGLIGISILCVVAFTAWTSEK